MDATVEQMEAQLNCWRLEIDDLAVKAQRSGRLGRFDAVMHVDELKALHAIAQSRLVEFQAAGDSEQPRLKTEVKRVWKELTAAFKNPTP